jgi:hypothetical protein
MQSTKNKIYPIAGTDGNDTLQGNLAKDTLIGGNGDDLYIINTKGVKISEKSNAGIDSVQSNISYTLEKNVENLTLLGLANLNGTGNELNNVFLGNSGKNVLKGMAGNDTLIGGKGTDKLTGGKGADIFVFTSVDDSGIDSQTRDVITDFKHSENDLIDLSKMGMGFSFLGSQSFNKTDATGQLRFDAKQHILFGSTDADSQPEFSILLSGVKNLTTEDFIFKSLMPVVVPPDPVVSTPAESTVFIKSSTTVTATNAVDVFDIAVGSYSVTISGFGKGDKLKLFPSASITFKRDMERSDGIKTITAVNGETLQDVTIILTGLQETEDANVFNVPSFNNVFGVDAIS